MSSHADQFYVFVHSYCQGQWNQTWRQIEGLEISRMSKKVNFFKKGANSKYLKIFEAAFLPKIFLKYTTWLINLVNYLEMECFTEQWSVNIMTLILTYRWWYNGQYSEIKFLKLNSVAVFSHMYGQALYSWWMAEDFCQVSTIWSFIWSF